jgi:hypothetical protein
MDRLKIPFFSRAFSVIRIFSAQLAEGGGWVLLQNVTSRNVNVT